jgi:beta-glucosidase-like glycosyl hydrolase
VSTTAQLLIPALRADADGRFTTARSAAIDALAQGVGGFVLYGGDQDAVRALTKELQQRSRVPLLIGADLERGAGQQFTGATGLPPLAALAWLGDAEALRRAARLTAREARTLGVNWDIAPVLDLDLVDTSTPGDVRSLGTDPAAVARWTTDWITACQAEGVVACAKHFPGHGRAPAGATGRPPIVSADRDTLHATDLVPFRAAIDMGVASMMTAHVAYPALDPSGAPATQSREILQWTLRQQLRYDNLVVGDGPAMAAALGDAADEGEAAVRAIGAGCDVIVAPLDLALVSAALERALEARRLDAERVRQSGRRRLKWAQWAAPPNDWRRPTASDAAWGAQLADRVIHVVRGVPPRVGRRADLLAVGGSPAQDVSARGGLVETLRTAGINVQLTTAESLGSGDVPVIICTSGDPAAAAVAESARASGRPALIALFAHPRFAESLPTDVPVVCAWTDDPAMQRAAARWIAAKG